MESDRVLKRHNNVVALGERQEKREERKRLLKFVR